jgi:hypothetical protein
MIGDTNNRVMAAEGAAEMGGFPGLAMQMSQGMETMGPLARPGFWAGFNNYRYQQTLIKGGFKDSRFFGIRAGSRRAGLRSFRSRTVISNRTKF